MRAPGLPDIGWFHFARAFHPFRYTEAVLGGWAFIGFDSGPSLFSALIVTRGLLPESVARLRDGIDRAAANGRTGVVLFSHAPTRAVLRTTTDRIEGDGMGSMYRGGRELEAVLLDAARARRRVLHLSGHTHWSDVFESTPDGSRFVRAPFESLTRPRALDGTVAMVNTPSATFVTFRTVGHGVHAGFVVLDLRPDRTELRFELRDRNDRPAQRSDVPRYMPRYIPKMSSSEKPGRM